MTAMKMEIRSEELSWSPTAIPKSTKRMMSLILNLQNLQIQNEMLELQVT